MRYITYLHVAFKYEVLQVTDDSLREAVQVVNNEVRTEALRLWFTRGPLCKHLGTNRSNV